jgi:cytidyltransferase-like protein
MKKRGMVFGVFDGLHEGHKYFLQEAHKQCDELVVVVTMPEMVEMIKKRQPKYSFEDRGAAIIEYFPNVKIIPSDTTLGAWTMFKTYTPDIVILGYDQHGIARELEKMNMPFVVLNSHFPEKYKSGILNKD